MSSDRSRNLTEKKKEELTVLDVIYAARFKDIFCFISLRELINGKKKLTDTFFKLTGNYKFNLETQQILNQDNNNISVTNTINLKRKIPEIFNIDFLYDPEKIKLSFVDLNLQKSLRKFKNGASGFIKVVGDKIETDENRSDTLKKNIGFLDKKDLRDFIKANLRGVPTDDVIDIKNSSLPRVCDDSFLINLFNNTGPIETDSGYFCWNIDTNMKIFPNIVFDNTLRILELNTYQFNKKVECRNNKLREEDHIIGITIDGILRKAKFSYLVGLKEEQENNIEKLRQSNTGFLSSFTSKFSYPFVSNAIIVSRESTDILDLETGGEGDTSSRYINAFYETLSPNFVFNNREFGNKFRKEFLDFIMVRYVENNKLILKLPQYNKQIIDLLQNLEKDIQLGSPRLTYYDKPFLKKEDFVSIVETITGRSERSAEDPNKFTGDGLRVFLRDIKYNIDVKGRTFPLMRYASYFIFCNLLPFKCQEIKKVFDDKKDAKGEIISQGLYSILMLENLPGEIDQYKLYYDPNINQFTQFNQYTSLLNN